MRLEDDAPEGTRISDIGDERALADLMSVAMRRKLKKNRGKRHWRMPEVTDEYLIQRLREEMIEFLDALKHGTVLETWDEAGDMANFLAMLCDRKGHRE
jgi:NTP pyrophosphatase (non-canonical NTP hydrolase)